MLLVTWSVVVCSLSLSTAAINFQREQPGCEPGLRSAPARSSPALPSEPVRGAGGVRAVPGVGRLGPGGAVRGAHQPGQLSGRPVAGGESRPAGHSLLPAQSLYCCWLGSGQRKGQPHHLDMTET